jgi:hypothetical protein
MNKFELIRDIKYRNPQYCIGTGKEHLHEVCCGSGWIRIILVGRIRICVGVRFKVINRIRISFKVKIQELRRLKMEPWRRAVDAYNGGV